MGDLLVCFFLGVNEMDGDDSQRQINQKEPTDQHQNYEVGNHVIIGGLDNFFHDG